MPPIVEIFMAKNVGMTVMGRPTALFVEADETNTVADAYAKLGLSGEHTATVSGEPATMTQTLNDGDFVVFAKATKGGSNLVLEFWSMI
jgi:hypothetical protein